MIRPGEEWGSATTEPPDLEVRGRDRDLSRAELRGRLVRFDPEPDSDLARAIGLEAGTVRGLALPLDLLDLGPAGLAVNMVVVGTPPDRVTRRTREFAARADVDGRNVHDGPATTILVAVGEFLRGHDIVPRGHPGDGRAETQVYALAGRERRAMRRRLRTGTHLPHPAIAQRAGRRVSIAVHPPQPLEIDGLTCGLTSKLVVAVEANAYRLLV